VHQPRRRPAAAVAAVLLLAGCTAGAKADEPNWKPQRSFQGEGHPPTIAPAQPQHPSASGPPAPGGAPSSPPNGSGSPTNANDPAVVAKHLAAPTGLVLMPDGTALVGERTTGRIVRVQPVAGRPVQTVRTLTGLRTSGDGGLLDLALSPHYLQDALIFAYLTTATDNRVVAFTLTGPVTPVLTGIPNGANGNAGRITFGPDGSLYVGTGDAGTPANAANARSLAGKVLRVTDIGEPATGNPDPASPVFSSGHRTIAGLCAEPDTGSILAVEDAGNGGVLNVLAPGAAYGWPTSRPGDRAPLAQLPSTASAPGGCAVADGVLYVTSLDGKQLLSASVRVKGNSIGLGKFAAEVNGTYGRLRTVVSAPDGALWLTTSNKDGHGKPVPDDERVIRIVPSGGSGNQPV
jgi:glucose/arabinose dehydrogenase